MDIDKSATAAQFSAHAGAYAESQEHLDQADLDIVLRFVAPTGTERVLDVATGPGHTAAFLAPHVAEVVAVDLADGMVAQAHALMTERGLSNVTVALADVDDLPYLDGSFDVVTCRIAPHHFAHLDSALHSIRRVARSRFVVEDSCVPEDPQLGRFLNGVERVRDPTHVESYSLGGWTERLERAGFRVARSEPYRKRHAIDSWMARAGVDAARRAAVLEAFAEASPAAVEEYEIVYEDGRAVSYTDDKIIIRADVV
jgi:SAM-dependent methyltransferase